MAFAGIDRSTYPGDDVMTSLIGTNLRWTCFYLAPTPSHRDTGWMDRRDFLANLGWGFAPTYVGQQDIPPGSMHPSSDQGTADGNEAVQLANNAGFPANSILYLDVENGSLSQAMADYCDAWFAVVAASGYRPGVYCSHRLGNHFASLDSPPVIWAFNINNQEPSYQDPFPADDPSGCGVAAASAWQFAHAATISWGDSSQLGNVDMDTAAAADPSNF